MLIIFLLFIVHWYAAMFCHSFFQHRYAAHKQFYLSPNWEKVWFVITWLSQGATYLSPTAYGIMHRVHHAHSDTEEDPHSPHFVDNFIGFYNKTKQSYLLYLYKQSEVDDKFLKDIPRFQRFDKFAYSKTSRFGWIAIYTITYLVLAPNWWYFLLLPIHIFMTPIQGGIINWFAHQDGWPIFYKNFKLNNHSVNILPIDFLFWGEAYHNNHHARPMTLNLKKRWYEFDTMYWVIQLFAVVHILKLRKV